MVKVKDLTGSFVRKDEDGLIYLDIFNSDYIRLTGLAWKEKNNNYHRMDDEFTSQYSLGVNIRSNNTSGVQAAVKTNTKKIGVYAQLNTPDFMEHMTDNGVGAVDIYKGNGSEKRFWQIASNYNRSTMLKHTFACDGEMIDYTFNLPLYSGMNKMEIGLEPDADIDFPTPFSVEKPVLFYGSSITQGGCASRPGNNYVNTLSRLLNINIINLGFSSNCRGEELIANLISSLDLACFVMDYDHNAPNAEHLTDTHEKFFKIIRKAHPELPVILISKPDYDDNPSEGDKRKAVILKTYNNALAEGDKNVYFVDGQKFFGDFLRDSCTVDRNHPTDLGFARMAEGVYPVLKQALGL